MTVQEFHTAIDKIIDATQVKQESCCGTCTLATCCNEMVYVGKDEVQWMLDSLTPEQLSYVRHRTTVWGLKAIDTGMMNEQRPSAYKWITYKIPCPFLKDKKCIAYDRRPMSCRMWFARSNPENCDMPGRLHQLHASFPPENPGNSKPLTDYFHQHVENKTLHMDHLGVILVELLFGIKMESGATVKHDSMDNLPEDEGA